MMINIGSEKFNKKYALLLLIDEMNSSKAVKTLVMLNDDLPITRLKIFQIVVLGIAKQDIFGKLILLRWLIN